MTRQLEEFFNLPATKKVDESSEILPTENLDELQEVMKGIDKIEQALPMVKNLETADREMDHLAELAEEKFKELMDLGMSVEPRFSGTILQTAGTLLGHAITAKQAKIDKKLRMIELQLKKARLDQTAPKEKEEELEQGNAVVLNRNDLIRSILESNRKS
jgi:hypothetical protein